MEKIKPIKEAIGIYELANKQEEIIMKINEIINKLVYLQKSANGS